MEIKILQVFYGKDGLPYKDKDRQVHFPIAGTGFLGASNTTQIKFYYDELDSLDETTWVAVSKLPNGKIGSRVLESHLDSDLNEHYALLELDNYYTQYKGDVFISLQGYQGGVDFDYDEENSQYEIHGTPTIAATGSIKFTINYANQFVGSGETDNINFQRILAALGTKLGMRAYSEHVEELPSEGSPDVFYVVNDDPNNPNIANIYIWNENTEHYIWVGDNTLDLGEYYTKEQGEQFESDIDGRVTSVENELSSLGQGGPKGTYATVAALTSADPDHSYTYLVTYDNKWYYWNGTQWAAGGTYLTANLSDYVPYTGATQNVDLGSRYLYGKFIDLRNGNDGDITIGSQTSYIEFKSGLYFNRKYNNVITSFTLPSTGRTADNISTEYFVKTCGVSKINGTYNNLTSLQTNIPSGNDGSYLIVNENCWYYWNGSAWTNGGYYLDNPNYVLTTKDAILNATVFNAMTMCSNNGYTNASGTFISDSSYRTSDFIRVYANHNYKYHLKHGTTLPVICFYTDIKQNTFVSAVTGVSGFSTGTFIPTQDGYVRISRINTTDTNYFYDDTSKPDWAAGINDNVENVLNNHTLGHNSQVCFSFYDNVVNAFITASGGKTNNNNYRTTMPVFVKQGQTIKYKIKHATTLPIIALYSKCEVNSSYFIEKVNGIDGYTEGTYTPSQDGYVAFCYYKNMEDDNLAYVDFGNHIPELFNNIDINNVVGKLNVLLMGDSIFGNDGEIAQYLGKYAKSCVNGAFGGTRVTNRGGMDNFQWFDGINLITALTTGTWTNQDAAAEALSSSYSWVPTRLATLKAVDMSQVDVLIMDWGTNDYTGSATIAEINAAYNSIFDMLQATYPKLRILVTTPIWRYWGTESQNDNGDTRVYNISTLKQIANAIESNCKDRRINVLNAYQELPLSYKNASTYYDSGYTVHLNANGNLMYAHLLRGKLNSIF